jgi:ubiquitin C-terminal hydrolase
VHVLAPEDGQSVNTLISNSDSFTSLRSCTACKLNTTHQYSKEIFIVPKVLVVVINRSSFRGGVLFKNKFKICINQKLTLKSSAYELIGIIHHHGEASTSGHYTSWIKYINQFYSCNDASVKALNIGDSVVSNTAYMLLYNKL